MILPYRVWLAAPLLCALIAFTPSVGTAQTAAAPDHSEEKPQRVAIGFKVRTLPARSLSIMDNGRSLKTTTVAKTVYDWNYNTSSKSLAVGGGLVIELMMSPRWRMSAEFIYSPLSYSKTTDQYWGTDDPNTSTDERSHKSTLESTKARLYDVPLLLHWQVSPKGFLSHLYLAGGPSVRLASTVKTTNNITNADATQETNHDPAPLAKRTLIGATVGVGLRFMDDFKIKVSPEVRYTRWNGMTFAQDSTLSPRNQLEVSLSFTR